MFKNSTKGKEFITTVLDVVNELKEKGISYGLWNKAVVEMKKKFPEEEFSKESLRSLYRYYKHDALGERHISLAENYDLKRGLITLEDRLLERTKRKVSLPYLEQILQADEADILVAYANLQAEGYINLKLWTEGGVRFMQNITRTVSDISKEYDLKKEFGETTQVLTFGLIGDTHIGSEFHDAEALQSFYDICEERGIRVVFHTGDMTEGFKSNRVETFLGNVAIGFQDQIELVVKTYPYKEEITTYFITGNHDLWAQQSGLANVGRSLTLMREDLKFLGDEFAKVQLSEKVTLGLIHPRDGVTKNVFYKAQTYIDEATPDKMATINALGHYHKMGIIKHRDVYGIYTGSFQIRSDWMRKMNLKSYVGGYIITVKLNERGDIVSLIPEFIDFGTHL